MYDILIISDDVVGEKMAGPGIRAWELSKSLSNYYQVCLAAPDYSYKSDGSPFFQNAPFGVFFYSVKNPAVLEELSKKSKIILTQGYILSKFPRLKHLNAHLVVDIYVPFILENLFVHKWKVPSLKDRESIHLNDLRVFNDQLIHGDHFLCANIRQKDLFIGSLMALNRTLRSLTCIPRLKGSSVWFRSGYLEKRNLPRRRASSETRSPSSVMTGFFCYGGA